MNPVCGEKQFKCQLRKTIGTASQFQKDREPCVQIATPPFLLNVLPRRTKLPKKAAGVQVTLCGFLGWSTCWPDILEIVKTMPLFNAVHFMCVCVFVFLQLKSVHVLGEWSRSRATDVHAHGTTTHMENCDRYICRLQAFVFCEPGRTHHMWNYFMCDTQLFGQMAHLNASLFGILNACRPKTCEHKPKRKRRTQTGILRRYSMTPTPEYFHFQSSVALWFPGSDVWLFWSPKATVEKKVETQEKSI